MEDQVTSTMTGYPTQSYYPETEPTSHCPVLINAKRLAWRRGASINFEVIGSTRAGCAIFGPDPTILGYIHLSFSQVKQVDILAFLRTAGIYHVI